METLLFTIGAILGIVLFFGLLICLLTTTTSLKIISSFLKSRIINTPDGLPYLKRHYIYKTPDKKIFLHRFFRSDGDRDLHCHPWRFQTFILNSGYLEHLPTGVRKVGKFSLVKHEAVDAHSVELYKDKNGKEIEAWTLVVVGKKTREWGFHTPKGWIPYNEYFDNKFGKGKWNEEKEVIAMNEFMEE